eukprot:scaffold1659_cov33-Phaeocystis_antarctica.AAC.2
MPRAAHLGRRSWVGRHRQPRERLGHLLRGRVLHRHREALHRERHERARRPRRLVVLIVPNRRRPYSFTHWDAGARTPVSLSGRTLFSR